MSFETYLVSPPVTDVQAFRSRLEAAIAALKPASILLDIPPGDERNQINTIKALAPLAQDNGIALLVNTSPLVSVRGGADGVHVASSLLVGPAREVLKTERIVGASGLTSRHDAMDAGEAGADYVMFGEPRQDGSMMTLSALVDRASWWAEVFETPCVVFAPSAASVEAVALTGAEFVALGPWSFDDPAEAARIVGNARTNLALKGKQPA